MPPTVIGLLEAVESLEISSVLHEFNVRYPLPRLKVFALL